jgi:hypothetical protein
MISRLTQLKVKKVQETFLSQNVTFRQAGFVVLCLALGQFILQGSLLTRGVEYVTASLTIDDTYYYLQTAWNTKQLGFVTFDGLHPTNGVQLSWFVITLLLAALASTKTVLLFATMVVSFLLNGLCYFIILKIGGVLKQPLLALFMAGLWSLQSLPFRIYSMGMENSLHALVFWCVIWQCTLFLIQVQNKENPNFWSLTIILILNVWTRLDSALLSTVLYTFCTLTLASTYRGNIGLFLQKYFKVIAGSIVLAGFGLFIQLCAFWLMGNSFLPVSALVKTSGSNRGLSFASVDKLVEVVTLGMPSILQGRLPAIVLILLGVFAIVVVLRARTINSDHSIEQLAFLNLWACLLVGEVLYHLYIAISGVQYTLYFIWYRSPSFIFWIVTLSLIALFTSKHVATLKERSKVLLWAPVGFSLLMVVVAVYLFARSINFTSDLYSTRYDAALWIAKNSPPDTIFASWNAGQLGFFSDRTFINLDGVINSVDYYENVLSGSIPLTDYLFENRVEYIVDYDTYGAIPDFPVIQRFPLNDESGRLIQIWQVPTQISSAH